MEGVLLLIWFLLTVSLAWAWFGFAPWMPTRTKDLEKIDKVINLQPWEKFLEFGCGTARVCSFIARKHPDVQVVWIEYARPLFVYSWLKQKFCWPKNLRVIFANGFTYPLHSFDMIYTFGMNRSIEKKLRKKLQQEMKLWARFLSYVFKIENWEWWSITHYESDQTYSWMYVYKKW
jgi:SAM-dependent methyltransferase